MTGPSNRPGVVNRLCKYCKKLIIVDNVVKQIHHEHPGCEQWLADMKLSGAKLTHVNGNKLN